MMFHYIFMLNDQRIFKFDVKIETFIFVNGKLKKQLENEITLYLLFAKIVSLVKLEFTY